MDPPGPRVDLTSQMSRNDCAQPNFIHALTERLHFCHMRRLKRSVADSSGGRMQRTQRVIKEHVASTQRRAWHSYANALSVGQTFRALIPYRIWG
jgi:hypothetical protein